MRVIGLMSGTSADGIDAALVEVWEGDSPPGGEPGRTPDVPAREPSPSLSLPGPWLRSAVAPLAVRLVAACTLPYPPTFRRQLLALMEGTGSLDELTRLHVALGDRLAAAAAEVARRAGLSLDQVDLIGSHGQTVRHLPPAGGAAVPRGQDPGPEHHQGATLQIGHPSVIAQRTGVTVVADFRPADMAAGGQGAPLVPWADYLLLAVPGRRRVVQNIGGIGNLTLLPASGRLEDVLAFDTGPGNMVIDGVVARLTQGRLPYDRDGQLAAAGKVSEPLLEWLLRHPFLQLPPPKSTGREEFGAAFVDQVLAEARALGVAEADLVATVTAFTAQSIALHYQRYVLPGGLDEVILGGGGADNPTLVRMLAAALHPVPIYRHEHFGIPARAKEALAFALLAYATWRGWPGNVPGATGAARSVVLGVIAPGRRWPPSWSD